MSSSGRKRVPYGLWAAGGITLMLGVLIGASLLFVNQTRRQSQMQADAKVVTAWVVGVAQGQEKTLRRGTILQKWLNEHGVHALGDYRELTGRVGNDPGGVEIWFDYQSHISGVSQLECHRVGETAFIDDLGQPYHGLLDFQDHYVGVYLPGYDHAARKLICALHWMPRRPALPEPVSDTMTFTIDLPPARRVLPPAETLGNGTASQTVGSMTATVSGARLSPPKLSSFSVSQRELTFRLKVQGGELANNNALQNYSTGKVLNFVVPSTNRPFVITDPYGISLLAENQSLSPLMTLDTTAAQNSQGTIWIAPVNGAGHGTDAIHLHFDVLPAQATSPAQAVPFDLTVPVQTGDEV